MAEKNDMGGPRSSLSTVLGVLAVGIAIGLVIGKVLWGGQPPSSAPDRQDAAEAPGPMGPAAPEPPSVSEPMVAARITQERPLDVLESEIDLWPARHLFIAVKGTSLDTVTKSFLRSLKPGGVVLLEGNIRDRTQTTRLVSEIKEAVGLGTGVADLPLVAVDQEGGSVNRLKLKDAPGALELAAKADLDAARDTGLRYAEECTGRGIGVVFAPVLDVYQPGAHKAMARRCFGSDNGVVTAMGLAFADGLMQGNVLAVAKHFPGLGASKEDSHTTLAVLAVERRTIAEMLFPFNEAVNCGIPGIMTGHIAVPSFDKDQPKRPASLSPVMVRFLRDRWNYKGVIVTDDLAMGAIAESHSIEDAAVQALAAGNDALVVLDHDPTRIHAVCQAIEQAVETDRLSREELVKSMKRLDGWQAWLRDPAPLEEPLPELPARFHIAKVEESAPDLPSAPASEVVHVVKQGDYMSRIAVKYGVTVQDIMAWNNLKDDVTRIGQRLIVKTAAPEVPTTEAPPTLAESEEPAKAPEPEGSEPVQETPDAAEAPETEAGPEVDEKDAEQAPPEAEEGDAETGTVDGEADVAKDAPPPDPVAPRPGEDAEGAPAEAPPETEDAADAEDTPSEETPPQGEQPQPGDDVAGEDVQGTDSDDAPDEAPEAAAPATPSDEEYTTYTVAPGDTLYSLARRFGVPSKKLLEINNMKPKDTLYFGRTIRIPKAAAPEPQPGR